MIQIRPQHLQSIQAHAESTYPEECCGLLVGRIIRHDDDSETKILMEVRQLENAWGSEGQDLGLPDQFGAVLTKTRRYWIDPKDMLEAQRYARDRHISILGIYHSHPDYPAVPSECDRAIAWSSYLYMIISVQQGSAQDLLCWSLDEHHQFQPEAMLTVTSTDT